MGVVLRRERCPRCASRGKDRSGDNLAVYSDHAYCFSCGYSKQTKGSARRSFDVRKTNSSNVVEQERKNVQFRLKLPTDFVLSIPRGAFDWLGKYGITHQEAATHRIGWSEHGFMMTGRGSNPKPVQYSPCMVVPIYSATGELLMYQARYFGNQSGLPKWFTKGNPRDILHVLGENEHGTEGPIVVVEDIVSAIKVSRFVRCMPLFGADLPRSLVNRLARLTDTLIIWLDNDKSIESHRFSRAYSSDFTRISCIHTERDPKEIPSDSIRTLVSVS